MPKTTIITRSTPKGGTVTRRVQATEYDGPHGGVYVSEGEKRAGSRQQFDQTTVVLTREEIAQLAKAYPVLEAALYERLHPEEVTHD